MAVAAEADVMEASYAALPGDNKYQNKPAYRYMVSLCVCSHVKDDWHKNDHIWRRRRKFRYAHLRKGLEQPKRFPWNSVDVCNQIFC